MTFLNTPFFLQCEVVSLTPKPKMATIKINKTIILPVVLYGCETWSLALSEECRLRVFGNRILRRIFGPKGDENGGVQKAP